jgi:hypothetical protein
MRLGSHRILVVVNLGKHRAEDLSVDGKKYQIWRVYVALNKEQKLSGLA